MQIKGNLFVPSKVGYVRGDKPDVDCLLCAIISKDPRVRSLEVFRSGRFSVCANLYPYSPDHLLIFPKRHMEDIRGFTGAEARELFQLEKKTLDILDKIYHPHGYNISQNRCKIRSYYAKTLPFSVYSDQKCYKYVFSALPKWVPPLILLYNIDFC
jgi:galactose-1-phosphate uridylyltransferase